MVKFTVGVEGMARHGKKLSSDDMAVIMTDVLTKVKCFFSMTDLNRTPDKWYQNMPAKKF